MSWTRAPSGTPPPKIVWKNGEFVKWENLTVHVYNIGGIAASGIYEGIRGYWNEEQKQLYINGIKPHVKRLFNSIKIMQLKVPFAKKVVEEAIPELVRKNNYKENIYIRPNVFDYTPPFQTLLPNTTNTWMTLIAFPRLSGLEDIHTRKVGVSSWLRPTDQIHPPRVKSIANLANGRLAENEISAAGYEESIQLTIYGNVAEMGQGANLCIIRDGSLITPSNRNSILEGVTKDIVFRLAKQSLDIDTLERGIDRTELYIAEEIFTCGTGHSEITPVVSVDGVPIGDGKPGKITMKLRSLYYDAVMGKKSEYMLRV